MRKTSGVSLILLIFLSLCLIVFSLLSLSGAVADETLSSQAADRTTEYYAAVSSSNALLAQIDEQLAEYLRFFRHGPKIRRDGRTSLRAKRGRVPAAV